MRVLLQTNRQQFIPHIRPRGAGFRPPQQPYIMGNPSFIPPIPPAATTRINRPRNVGRSSHATQQRSGQNKQRSSYPVGQQHPRHGNNQTGAMESMSAVSTLDTEMLARAPPAEQKQILGERLFPKVHSIDSLNSGKITGMLLEIDNAEILHMLENDESLEAKVDEARDVLRAHQHSNSVNGRAADPIKLAK